MKAARTSSLAALILLGAAGMTPAISESSARPIACAPSARSWLVPFETAPFPYDGAIPGTGEPFLDRRDGARRGHTSPRGGVYWEDATYSDRRVLLAVPRAFDPARPAAIVVFLHGNLATLVRDVCGRQGVVRQVAASGLNAVLVAPQFAVDALDSSAGRLWQPDGFRRLLDEAALRLAELTDGGGFERLPVIVAAYSGGYLPAAYGLSVGGAGDRVRALLLLDALFGEVDRIAEIVAARRGRMAFVSAYSAASRGENARLALLLQGRGIAVGEGVPAAIGPDTIAFVAATEAEHGTFMTRALAPDPLKALLARVTLGRPVR